VTGSTPNDSADDERTVERSGEVVDAEGVEERAARRTVEILEAKLHRGPLPSAEGFGEYERVLPGTAKAIVEEWRDEATHRRELQKRMVDANIKARSKAGRFLGSRNGESQQLPRPTGDPESRSPESER
jgi:uncharacterized membrane protein